jgi:membrane protease YdiL (CAAX protease family)
MIAGLFLSAVGFGVVFAWTRSLIPAIIAHTIFDIPMTPIWQGLLVAVLLISSLLIWRKSGPIVRQVFSGGDRAALWILALLGTGFAVAGVRIRGLEYVGVAFVVLAVALESGERRTTQIAT